MLCYSTFGRTGTTMPVEPVGSTGIRRYFVAIAMRCGSVPEYTPATRTVSTPAS